MKNIIKKMRSKLGKEKFIHPAARIIIENENKEILIIERVDNGKIGIPAGALEENETIEACIIREVEEETGYRAGTIVPLTEFFASPGILNERMHGFLATDLEPTSQSLDHDEEIEVFPIPQWQVRDMIKDRHIEDAKTIALLLYWMHLHSP